MPLIPKTWLGYPPNTSTPINPAALIGLENRVGNYVGSIGSVGPGAFGYDDYRVKQRGAGDMSVDVGLPNVLMGAYIALDTNGGVERYEYSGPQLNQAIPAADATNPRIDQIVLAPGITDSQVPTTAVVTGTPTAGATLINRNGATALPAQRTLLADVLVGAAATQILTAAIRDRRPTAVGNMPVLSAKNAVAFQAHPNFLPNQVTYSTTQNSGQVYAAFFLPRRIVLANTIRFKYAQVTAALTGTYNIAIADASGRVIAQTGVLAFNGATGTYNVAATITPITFEAGWHYVGFGVGVFTGGGAIAFTGVTVINNGAFMSPTLGGLAYNSGSGTTFAADTTGLQDVGVLSGSTTASLVVPFVSLSAE